MISDTNSTDNAMESFAPAPQDDADNGKGSDAGRDASIEERLQRDPSNSNARLDRALDESMDASDPPASTQPIHNHGPAPSSGYDPEAEQRRQRDGDA